MRKVALTPHLPFHDDELSQGYFTRNGFFHAGVPASTFCKYMQLDRSDFRNGSSAFTDRMAELTDINEHAIMANTMVALPGDMFQLRGERLNLPVVRRSFVRFCPYCLRDDGEQHLRASGGAWRFRWSWLLRPVVICPRHGMPLAELPAADQVRAFDLPKLIDDHDYRFPEEPEAGGQNIGPLQKYVEDRLWGTKDAAAWLDEQGIAPGVKASEMLGALIDGGPNAPIGGYTQLDWARVGDIGFRICEQGPKAILDVLGRIRIESGRRSGRAGPQAAYGFMFNWLSYTRRTEDFGPIRELVRDAILDNFAIAPGETILGEEVTQRRMHSVNSLVSATGINRFRLTRLMRKARVIPETTDIAAFNQWVFPAERGEQLIARIQNSIPLNRVMHVLGCSKTHAEQLAHHGLITSVVPIAEGAIGLTMGYFNHDDLAAFMDEVLSGAVACDAEDDAFVDLTKAARLRSSTAEILRWHLEGKLPGTRLIGGVRRLDHLRFHLASARALVAARRGPDLHRLTSVALMLGIKVAAVKKLVASETGGPWLMLAPAEDCVGLDGAAYVAMAEIERFQAEYATVAVISRATGIYYRAVQRILGERGIAPAFAPDWLGSTIYRRAEVAGFMVEFSGCENSGKSRGNDDVSGIKSAIFAENGRFGEPDDASL